MLADGGSAAPKIAAGLTAVSLINVATLFAMPLFALPAILGGAAINDGLARAAWLGLGAFVLLFAGGAALLLADKPVRLAARGVEKLHNLFLRRKPPLVNLTERLTHERDTVRSILGKRWAGAIVRSIGNVAFDYGALLAALVAVGASPRPSLVLLAYVGAVVIGMFPITPGGLGLVEAGLAGMLVLAGVSGAQATLATLAYRLASYWGPLVAGGGRLLPVQTPGTEVASEGSRRRGRRGSVGPCRGRSGGSWSAAMTTLRDLAAKVRAREIGSHELVVRSLRRIEALDPDLGAVVALRPEEALSDARTLDDLLARGHEAGSLVGLPLLVKDMTDVAGMRTTYGSQVFAGPRRPRRAMRWWSRASARPAPSLSARPTCRSSRRRASRRTCVHGTTRNPWNPERTCGGSSGGSAVALATGMAAIATATDGGGSVRIPAAYCGLVGLKPTNGVIGRDPIPELDRPVHRRAVLDRMPPIWRCSSTCSEGRPPAIRRRRRLAPRSERRRSAASSRSSGSPTSGRCPRRRRFPSPRRRRGSPTCSIARFEQITPSDLFGDRRIDDDWFTLCGVEHAHVFGRAWFDQHVDLLTPAIRDLFEDGFSCPTEEYLAARRRRFEYVRALDDLLGDDGVLVSPVMAIDACPAEGRDEGTRCRAVRVRRPEHHRASGVVRCRPGSIPSGVPFGLQVTAPRFRDDLLLDVAASGRRPSHGRSPRRGTSRSDEVRRGVVRRIAASSRERIDR